MKPYLVAAPCAIQPAQPVAAQSLETRTSDNYFSSPHNSSGTFEKSSADYYLSSNGNNKEGILSGYKRDNLLGWVVALAVLVWATAWAASKDCYSLPQQNNINRYRNNTKKEEKTSSNKHINDLLGPDGKLMLNEKTSKYIAEALDMGFDDKEADLYTINELIKEGYVFKEGEITEKELYSLLKGYEGNKKSSELKENIKKDKGAIEETDLEAEVENTEAREQIEGDTKEADTDSGEVDSE